MVPSNLNFLRGRSRLVHAFGVDVVDFTTTIELVSNLFEIIFHHVYVFFIILLVDAWVSDHADAIFVKALGHFH